MSDQLDESLLTRELEDFKEEIREENLYAPVYDQGIKIDEITESMDTYDKTTIHTQIARENLAKYVGKFALSADLGSSDADTAMNANSVVNTYASILRDIEKSARDHLTMKLKKKDTETNAAAVDIASFLAKIKTVENGTAVIEDKDIDKSLTDQEEAYPEELKVLDTELEMGVAMLPSRSEEDK